MIKIISGERRGAKLQTLEGMDTRPLRGRVRESLFSIIRPNLEGTVVWDLFAGSGGVGLESLSQGASKALFIEAGKNAQNIIHQNIRKLRYEDKTRLIRGKVPEHLRSVPTEYLSPDIVFVMPPYHSGLVETVLNVLAKPEFGLKPESLIIIETHRREDDVLPQQWRVFDTRQYGITKLTFYQLNTPDHSDQ